MFPRQAHYKQGLWRLAHGAPSLVTFPRNKPALVLLQVIIGAIQTGCHLMFSLENFYHVHKELDCGHCTHAASNRNYTQSEQAWNNALPVTQPYSFNSLNLCAHGNPTRENLNKWIIIINVVYVIGKWCRDKWALLIPTQTQIKYGHCTKDVPSSTPNLTRFKV